MLKLVIIISVSACLLLNGITARSQQHVFLVDTLTTTVDARLSPFDKVMPGDTVAFNSGMRKSIRILNFTGQADKPVIFMNHNGQVEINTDHYYGISILNCRFFRLTGTGNIQNLYGFNISRVANGAGMGIGGMSSDYEIDHISIKNCQSAGIFAKTDPDCSLLSTRENFTQYNTRIHDNYIGHVGTEGLYVGSTMYFGQKVNCDGKDTLLIPSLLEGVKIYKNIIEYSGWDGIQVSSASKNCQVYDNMVLFDSQQEQYSQMSGIVIGGGSKCDCYNNFISQGKGNGIAVYGLAGLRVFNNIIIDAGKDFFPADTKRMVYGIFVTDVSAQKDSSFNLIFNTIINPKSDGIRFVSSVTKNNLIASNAIINPGAFDYYEYGSTPFKGKDSYVMIPDSHTDVNIKNNYMARNSLNADFAADGYSLLEGSPLIKAAWPDNQNITFDYYYSPRRTATVSDIGAVEYKEAFHIDTGENIIKPFLYPNPAKTWLTIQYTVKEDTSVFAGIYNLNGSMLINSEQKVTPGQVQSMKFNVTNLKPGIYIYSLRTAVLTISGRFIKSD